MKKIASLAALLMCGTVLAGVTSTPQPAQYLIRLADKTYEKGTTAPKTIDECRKRAAAIIPHADCVTIEGFDNVGTCDGVAKPALARELDADGFVIKPPIRGKQLTETDWTTELQDYVPAPYPTCWVLGWREITEADIKDESVYGASVDEPVWHTPEEKAAYDAYNVQYNLPENVAIREEYARTHPPVLVGACGRYDSPECMGTGVEE